MTGEPYSQRNFEKVSAELDAVGRRVTDLEIEVIRSNRQIEKMMVMGIAAVAAMAAWVSFAVWLR